MLENSTNINVIDRHGKIIDSFSSELFKSDSHVYPRTISLVNHYYFSRKHKAVRENRKNRSEVSGGGRKPWRQKGLNKARQGSIRSPQWVGGGLCFGPGGEKKYLPNTNKVCRRKALLTMLVEKRYNEKLLILDRLELNEYKTREARIFLNNLNLTSSKVLIVLPVVNVNGEENQKYLVRSFRNLDGVSIINSDSLIVPNLLSCERTIILTRDSFHEVEKRILSEKKVSKKNLLFRSSLHNKLSEEKIN